MSNEQSGVDGKITVKYMNNVAIIQLDRGQNRVNLDFCEKVNKILNDIERNIEIKALITTGTDKYFCNGIDVDWFNSLAAVSQDKAREFRKQLFTLATRFLTFPIPTIAAINGHAFAYEAFLALAHDYRVMRSDRGWFSINEVHLGLRLNSMFLEIIRKKIPSNHFTDVVILGKRLTGEESKASGIVNELASQEFLIPTALNIAKKSLPGNGILRQNLKAMKMDIYSTVLDQQQTVGGSMPEKYQSNSKL